MCQSVVLRTWIIHAHRPLHLEAQATGIPLPHRCTSILLNWRVPRKLPGQMLRSHIGPACRQGGVLRSPSISQIELSEDRRGLGERSPPGDGHELSCSNHAFSWGKMPRQDLSRSAERCGQCGGWARPPTAIDLPGFISESDWPILHRPRMAIEMHRYRQVECLATLWATLAAYDRERSSGSEHSFQELFVRDSLTLLRDLSPTIHD